MDGGVASYAIDVTDIDETKRLLQQHIDTHEETLHRLPVAVAIFGPDQRLKFSNKAFGRLWDLDERWLATRPSDGEILERLRDARPWVDTDRDGSGLHAGERVAFGDANFDVGRGVKVCVNASEDVQVGRPAQLQMREHHVRLQAVAVERQCLVRDAASIVRSPRVELRGGEFGKGGARRFAGCAGRRGGGVPASQQSRDQAPEQTNQLPG